MQSDVRKHPSDEADSAQLELARREGQAYQHSLRYMVEEVADTGAEKRADDYLVGFAQERAEGLYAMTPQGRLEWAEPKEENCHLEIAVSDAGDGRFVPYLRVTAELIAASGGSVGPFELPFLWHPGLHHYGRNVKIPRDGRYTIRIRIEPPTFMRHDKENGRRYAHPVEVQFEATLKTGRE